MNRLTTLNYKDKINLQKVSYIKFSRRHCMSIQIHPNTSLGVVKLKVSDINRSVAFYENIIGLKAIQTTETTATLSANGVDSLLELEQTDQSYLGNRRGHTGLYHFALLVPSRKALGNILKHLIESRIALGQADHLVSEALYLSDPDQNGIEIYRDRPRHEWEYDQNDNVKMATDPIDWEGILAEADNRPFEGIDPATVMGHVHLHVADLNKAYEYYCQLIGFSLELDWSFNGALFVAAGRYHHHLGLNIWNGRGASPFPEHATGIKYYTIKIVEEAELKAIEGRLNEAGYTTEPLEKNGFFTKDPFGIGIHFELK